MSRVHNVEVNCPTCGHKFDTPLWESLNADIDPVEKDLLLSGKLFLTSCPKCRAEHPFVYPILYHDMKNSVMIQLVLSEEQVEDLLGLIKQMKESPMVGSMSFNDYRFRFARNHNELREKAKIFDSSLDDRVIELMKTHYRAVFSEKQPDKKLNDVFFENVPSLIFVFLAEDGGTYTMDFDMGLYEHVAKTRKNIIDEKSKNCYYINQEWALVLLKDAGKYNENLPFYHVHYGGEYMGFSDGRSENICLCLCQKQSVENRMKIFMQHYQYDSCLNPRNELLKSFLGLPKYFNDKIAQSGLPFGEEWLSFLQYSREICHICNSQTPDYRHSIYVHDSEFKKLYGHYLKSRFFHYGIDDMEHWGVYFVEEALTPEHKKLLCPTKNELAEEMSGFDDELDKLFALPKDQFDVVVYYRTKAKVLRDKKMIAYFHLTSELGFSNEFLNTVHSIIHQRFMAVKKSIRDELKNMIPKKPTPTSKKAPPTKKKKSGK